MVYSDDPNQRKMKEDSIVSWSFNEYIKNQDPKMLIFFPMAKAAFQIMKAVEQYTLSKGMAEIEGWFVTGISKRGWTTWLIGAT
jgi:PhoPQ-activated pathogenicity-related protein